MRWAPSSWAKAKNPLMTPAMLGSRLRQLFETSAGPEEQGVWQDCEPMLHVVQFFKRSIQITRDWNERQAKHRLAGAVLHVRYQGIDQDAGSWNA